MGFASKLDGKLGDGGSWICGFFVNSGMGSRILSRPRAPMARFKAGEVSRSVVQRAGFFIRTHCGAALPHTAALEVGKFQASLTHELSTRSGTGPWHGHKI